MERRGRRKKLAASFITTFGVLAGCSTPTPQEPDDATVELTAKVVATDAVPEPVATVDATATPEELPPTSTVGELREASNGTCEWQEDRPSMHCPEGAMCNPPPPFVMAVPCPKTRELPANVTIRTDGERCFFTEPHGRGGCPPGARCNPPGPRVVFVSCPSSLAREHGDDDD